ncbi:hypothetical protein COF64_10945 [Bacillus sp. AFS043905]|nr:hypothetical protein COF64_10945 [Bacillus sp. AFS043905]
MVCPILDLIHLKASYLFIQTFHQAINESEINGSLHFTTNGSVAPVDLSNHFKLISLNGIMFGKHPHHLKY